jgi:hypothetical protein
MNKRDLSLTPLSQNEFLSDAKPCLFKVFNQPCPLIAPFTPKMNSRFLIYNETEPINPNLLEVIKNISTNQGEIGFYFSFVETSDYTIIYPGLLGTEIYLKTYFIPYSNVNDYRDQYFFTSHVIYSQHGNWGVFVHYDNFLAMGGISEFINEINKYIPGINEEVHEFIRWWKIWHIDLKFDISWIPKMLEHIYGIEKAKIIIQRHKLDEELAS